MKTNYSIIKLQMTLVLQRQDARIRYELVHIHTFFKPQHCKDVKWSQVFAFISSQTHFTEHI